MGILNAVVERDNAASRERMNSRTRLIHDMGSVYEAKYADMYPKLADLFNSDKAADNYKGASTVHMMESSIQILDQLRSGPNAHMVEAVVQASLGGLNPRVLDVVRIFYPNQIAQELLDIQPLTGQIGQIFIMKPRYSNAVPGTAVGDEVFRNATYPTYNNYASEVTVDTVGTGNGSLTTFTATLSKVPVRPGLLTITTTTAVVGAVTGVDNGSGSIVGTGITSGTINYTTGAISVTFANAVTNTTPVLASYRYSSEISEQNIRQVEFDLTLVPVQARIHPLGYRFSVAAGLAAQAHLAIDVQDTMSQVAAQYIKIERDNRVVDLITTNATAVSSLNFDANTTGKNYDKRSFFGEIEIKVDEAMSQIQNTMGRGGLDFVICGRNAANVFMQSRTYRSEPIVAPIGAHKIGTLRDGTISVIKSLKMDPNTYVFGYKGYMAGDAATVLAEWIPLYFTPVFQNPTFNNQQGVMSMYDLFVNNAGYYVKGTLSNYAA